MASSYYSAVDRRRKTKKYDVFISFRGADVRNGFLSHLHDAMRRNQIDAFVDENLERGEYISESLLRIIDESYISVVIFSENYAYSPWCLNELAQILDCTKYTGQMVLPVFYRVDPSDVQELTGNFGDAMGKYREAYQKYKIWSWCGACAEIGKLAGLVSHSNKPDSKLVEEIVSYILEKLNHAFPIYSYDDRLVGIDSRVERLESLLCLGTGDVRVVGVWGMAGIGKTTIARQVFDRICVQFTSHYFVANVREKLEKCTLDMLQNDILYQLSGTENSKRRLPRIKVLLVLDDVNDLEQVELLMGNLADYGSGSRIIITSVDKQLLGNWGAKICEVEKLNGSEAFHLFSKYSFRRSFPSKEYSQVLEDILDHVQGIPLVLKVLGSNLRDKAVKEWEDELMKLKDASDIKIDKSLRVTYDGLSENEKEIFLAIACFFKGEHKHRVENIMDVLGSKIGMSRLLDRSLISITNNQLHMHDLLQQMGKDITRMETQLTQRRWLWHPKDIYHVLTRDKGTEAIEGISLDMSAIQELNLSSTAFERMYNLKFLKFYNSFHCEIRVCLPEGLDFLPDELRLLHWYQFPLGSLPLGSYIKNLVELHMPNSNLKELWTGVQHMENLKFVDLTNSKELIRIPDLSRALNLETLILDWCENLVEIPCLKCLNKLSQLSLSHCKSLCSLPSFLHLENLKIINLMNCSKITEFPEFPHNIEQINLNGTGIKQLHPSIGSLFCLSLLDLNFCTLLESLPDSFCNLNSLTSLYIRSCEHLSSLPENFGNLESLEKFDASGSGLIEIPGSIGNLKKLKYIRLEKCANLRSLPEKLGYLESLEELNINSCPIKGLPSSVKQLRALRYIDLEFCGLSEFPSCLCYPDSALESLSIGGNIFESIPSCINQLSKLLELHFSDCGKLKSLPSELPSLTKLYGNNCTSLQSAFSLFQLQSITVLSVVNCINLDQDICKQSVDHLLSTPWLERKMVCCPGNELPQWMIYKNTCGNSLFLSTPTIQHEQLALTYFCFSVVINPEVLQPCYDVITRIGCTVKLFRNKSQYFESDAWGVEFSDYQVSDKVVLNSEHIFFWSKRLYVPSYDEDMAIEFYAQDKESHTISNAVVKCAVHFHHIFNYVADEEKDNMMEGGGFTEFGDDNAEDIRSRRQRKKVEDKRRMSNVRCKILWVVGVIVISTVSFFLNE